MYLSHFLLYYLIATVLKIEAKKINYSKYCVVSCVPQNKADQRFLRKLQRQGKIQLWNEGIGKKQTMLVQCKRSYLQKFANALRKRNMIPKVVIPNLEKAINTERLQMITNSRSSYVNEGYDFSKYHRLEDIWKFLRYLTGKYKDISKLTKIGNTYEKRPVYAVEITASGKRKKNQQKGKAKTIMIDCGTHAREWPSISFCVYFINELITGYERGGGSTILIDKYDFIIIPVQNPDGFVYSMNQDRMWRKNRRIIPSSNCIGVDLNRNYDINFCRDPESKKPCSVTYCGAAPFSEPETVNVVNLLKKTAGTVKAYISFHTYGQMWLLPWAKTYKTVPRDYGEMERVAEIGVQALARRYGTQYRIGSASRLVYVGSGILLDYVYQAGYTNYSYVLEMRDTGEHGFLLPANKLLPLCLETTDALLAAIMAMK